MSGPALPWANPPPPETGDEKAEAQTEHETENPDENEKDFLTLEEAGVAVGGRVEVKWVVEPDDGEAYFRWWGATVVGPSIKEDAVNSGAPVYELLYDPHDDFEQERGHVVFTAEHTLRQLDQKDELTWRREGDTWEDEGEEDEGSEGAEDEEEEGAEGDVVFTTEELRQMVDKEFQGQSLEDLESEALNTLEPSARIAVAAGFRDFADHMISFLHERTAQGGSLLVTADDVRAFTESFKKKRRTT